MAKRSRSREKKNKDKLKKKYSSSSSSSSSNSSEISDKKWKKIAPKDQPKFLELPQLQPFIFKPETFIWQPKKEESNWLYINELDVNIQQP